MTKGFSSFVMLAAMRTGSNYLEAQLNALPGVTCLGEMFNPHFIGKKDQTEAFGIDLETRERDPGILLQRMRQKSIGLTGFRYFHDHDPRIMPILMQDPSCAKIVLTRNPVDSYVSWKIAQATGQWKLTNAKNIRTAKANFDGAEFEAYLTDAQEHQVNLMHQLQLSGQTAFYIDYEDISDLGVLNGLAAWLGVNARLEALDDKLKKQNPEELCAKVSDPAAMEASLARLDRFNLARTPNFEPRRPPAIPSFVAATQAPLLYMPLRGGPEGVVNLWLKALSPEGVIDNFVQKTLRQWKRANPGHRSFTVLRHPLLRAHSVFISQIVSGRLAEHRSTLIRAFKADLPPAGLPFEDQAQHQAGFMAFLHYARLSTAGQAGQKVDPHWASQSAVLQGFAGFQGPDLVIREDRLAEGLSWLTKEVGLEACPELVTSDQEAQALDAIWSLEIEDAARDAWARDYMGFGFGPWRQNP